MKSISIYFILAIFLNCFLISRGFLSSPNRINISPVVKPNLELSSMAVPIDVQNSAVRAVSKLLATCGFGILSAKQGILDSKALEVLSKLVFNLFQPCLLFVNVAQTISAESVLKNGIVSYILPAAAVLQILIGFSIGKIFSSSLYGSESSRESKQLMACITFGNSGPLPLVFTDVLFRLSPDKSLITKSVSYISLYLLGWSPIFWILGTNILDSNQNDVSKDVKRKKLLKSIFRYNYLIEKVSIKLYNQIKS